MAPTYSNGQEMVSIYLIKIKITTKFFKFGGEAFHGVQTDSSKFGVICLKLKVRREFFLFLIGNTQ